MFQFGAKHITNYLNIKQKNKTKDKQYIKQFEVIKQIGKGHYGEVLKVKKNKENYALKKIIQYKKKWLDSEINCLKHINKSNKECQYIVRFYQSFEISSEELTKHYLVFELCKGIELFEYITVYERLNELQTKKIIKMLLKAIKFLHDLNIVHRDVKPENIMVEYNENNLDIVKNIKLIDFGLAKHLPENFETRMSTKLGTPYYMSPEILNKDYNYLCDEWSIGVIFYILLAGYPPFNSENDFEIMKKIKEKNLVFYKTEWDKYENTPIINIISHLLNVEKTRISCEKCLEEAWFLNS